MTAPRALFARGFAFLVLTLALLARRIPQESLREDRSPLRSNLFLTHESADEAVAKLDHCKYAAFLHRLVTYPCTHRC